MTPEIDYGSLSDDALAVLASSVAAEVERRRVMAAAAAEVERVTSQWLHAAGRAPGAPWAQPTGAHDAYPVGWVVAHRGAWWVSLVPGNVWEPGTEATAGVWRREEEATTPDDGAEDGPGVVGPVLEWSGDRVAYAVGDRATRGEAAYRCIQAHTSLPTWAPEHVPSLWERIEL